MTHPVVPLRKPLACAISSILFAALLPAPVGAQTQSSVAPGSAPSNPAPVLVTATRVAQPAGQSLSDHEIIGPEEIAQAGVVSVAELLQKRRGVEIGTYGGPGSTSSVFLRGTDNKQTVVLVDGVRVGSPASGGTTWAAIPLSMVDRIEIVYGAMSGLYGADAVGGVVQIFTKQGSGPLALEAAVSAGSFGTRSLEASLSGSGGALRYALTAAKERADGFSITKPAAGPYTYNPDKDGYERDSFSGQFALTWAKGHEVGLNVLRSRLANQFDAGPGFDDRAVEQMQTFALHSRDQFTPDWSSTLRFSQSEDNNHTTASYGNSKTDTRQTIYVWQNDITFGTDLLQVVLENRKEDVNSSSKAMTRERDTRSLALAWQMQRGQHSGSFGLRNDDSSQYGSVNTGNLAYGYRFSDNLRASARFGTSFRAPGFSELYYPNYGISSNRPEYGRNAEVGLRYQDGATHATASLFRNRVRDLLVYANPCPVEQATHRYGCAFNVNQAQITGLSLGGAVSPLQGVTLRGSLDLQNPRDETARKQLARRSRQHGSLALEVAPGRYLAGLESVFSGKRFDDAGNFSELGGYAVFNLYGNVDLAKGWSLFGRVNNLFGKDYELSRSYVTGKRNLMLGVRYTGR